MASDVIDIYEDIAAQFDSTRNKSLMEKPYLDRALGAVKASPVRVLDLGCGTGEPIAAYFIQQGCHVTGIDGAAAMIDMARRRFPDHDWRVADMRDLDLAERFDIIVAWHSFFHLSRDDQRAMFPVFTRHLSSGGVVALTSGTMDGEVWGEMHGHRVYHASLATEDYRQLAQSHGMRVISHDIETADCGGATIWVFQKDDGRAA